MTRFVNLTSTMLWARLFRSNDSRAVQSAPGAAGAA